MMTDATVQGFYVVVMVLAVTQAITVYSVIRLVLTGRGLFERRSSDAEVPRLHRVP